MQQRVSLQFELLDDAQEVARETARVILASAAEAVAGGRPFRLVLAGGTTPMAAYRILAESEADWDAWEVYFGDERCLPTTDPARNSLAARDAFLDRVPIPRAQIFDIPAELGAEPAAEIYGRTVEAALPFDLVLLGMGEDGHTASLFPGHPVAVDALVQAVYGAPKPPSERVSLSLKALASCRRMLILVTGAGKREALAAWRRGVSLPVARVATAAKARVLMDCQAAGDRGSRHK